MDIDIVVNQISRRKNIPREEVISLIENAYEEVLQKEYGEGYNFEASYDDGEVNIEQVFDVVEEVEEPKREAAEASLGNIQATAGDQLSFQIWQDKEKQKKVAETYSQFDLVEEPVEEFSRIAIDRARDMLSEKVSEIDRERAFNLYQGLEGEIVTGTVRYRQDDDIIADLGDVQAVLPYSEQMPDTFLAPQDRFHAVVKKVQDPTHKHQIILSRSSPLFIEALFNQNIDEIREGKIEIVEVAREQGKRCKVAVKSHEKGLSAVGPCIGRNGRRIKQINNKVNETIDVIKYSPRTKTYVKNALGDVNVVSCEEKENSIFAKVPEEEMKQAIGKGGVNARLATELVGKQVSIDSIGI